MQRNLFKLKLTLSFTFFVLLILSFGYHRPDKPFRSANPSSALSRRREWHQHQSRGMLYGGLTRPHKDMSAIMRAEGRLQSVACSSVQENVDGHPRARR